jgi:hypothetical protein
MPASEAPAIGSDQAPDLAEPASAASPALAPAQATEQSPKQRESATFAGQASQPDQTMGGVEAAASPTLPVAAPDLPSTPPDAAPANILASAPSAPAQAPAPELRATTADQPAPQAASAALKAAAQDGLASAQPAEAAERPSLPRRARFTEGVAPTRSAPPPNPPRPQPAPSPDANAAQIFETDTPDRSAQEWAKLLFEATRPASQRAQPMPPSSPQAPAKPAAPPAEPLAESSRRFLRPLVGVDPADVRVRRDLPAQQAAAELGADAAAVGGEVLLGAGHDERSPATLGLLAHELTHVAQQRTPRFVPPVLQASASAPADAASDEAVARAVEARVTRAARVAFTPPAPGQPATPPAQGLAPPARADASEWGGLPAPWEPMPAWAGSAWAAAPAAQPGPASPPAAISAPAAPAAASAGPAAVQLAETARSLDDDVPQPAPAAAPGAAPTPDLDALARQVYTVLKQRLAAERRRLG